MARGKVITTHLRTGDPNGIRTVFISNKICEMIVFPKSEFEMVSLYALNHLGYSRRRSYVTDINYIYKLPEE